MDVEQLRVQVYWTLAKAGQPPPVEELAEVLAANDLDGERETEHDPAAMLAKAIRPVGIRCARAGAAVTEKKAAQRLLYTSNSPLIDPYQAA